MTTKGGIVRVEDNFVDTRFVNANSIVGKALAWIQIEDKENAGSLESDHLVRLMLPGDVPRVDRRQPAVLFLSLVEGPIEFVHVLVTKELVVGQIELAPCVVVTFAVSHSRKVEPFWVAKFITYKVEPSFAA